MTNEELQTLVIYATRYAIGRMTYAPSQLDEIIRKYLPSMSKGTLVILIQDIERENDMDNLGEDFDRKMWLDLLETLKNEYKSREG